MKSILTLSVFIWGVNEYFLTINENAKIFVSVRRLHSAGGIFCYVGSPEEFSNVTKKEARWFPNKLPLIICSNYFA